ncbi:MAG: cell division protein FtsZ [Bacteroidota bacterium]|nr:cell division protein FtsZ [Bacteroidota bacterium]
MSFSLEIPKGQNSIIKVIGVGGGGGNAVDHMYRMGIHGVDFLLCNTDSQALDRSSIPNKIELGTVTDGRGAGANPEVGRKSAQESLEQVKNVLGTTTKMVFITAGMGGGTGTGAAPVIAKAAKELGILTIGIITLPFVFEGKKKRAQALEGLKNLRACVDTLLVIDNDRLMKNPGFTLTAGFGLANDVLTTAAKGIAEIITITGLINVDFEDVKTVMQNSGVAIMGTGKAEGEGRAMRAVEMALNSPLLMDNDISGANYVLLNITSGSNELTMGELTEITDFIQENASQEADVIWGYNQDESLGDNVSLTIIATGFNARSEQEEYNLLEKQSKTHSLDLIINHSPAHTHDTILTKSEAVYGINQTKKLEDFSISQLPDSFEEELPHGTVISTMEHMETANPQKLPTANHNAEETKPKQQAIPQSNNEASRPNTNLFENTLGSRQVNTATPLPRKGAEQVNKQVYPQHPQHGLRPITPREQEMSYPKHVGEPVTQVWTDEILNNLDEPAYLRNKVQLNDVPHSSETNYSKLTVSFNDVDEKGSLKSNNRFLDDNVD